jgi:dsRNA-specific ribonuclease
MNSIKELMENINEDEMSKKYSELFKIPDDVIHGQISKLNSEIGFLKTKISVSEPNLNKDVKMNTPPKAILFELLQKNGIEPISFVHNFVEYDKSFISYTIFNYVKFVGVGGSKKAAEHEICDKILKYIYDNNIYANAVETTTKNPKSILYEYIQKHKLPKLTFKHEYNYMDKSYYTSTIFDNNTFYTESASSKREGERNVSERILEYIDQNHSISYYETPEEYDGIIYIDLENATKLPLEILENYKKYRIISYLAYNHALMDKQDFIKRFSELKSVSCSDKDAVDIMITIDIARLQPLVDKGEIKKVYLITADHFGKTVEKLVDYCECINDYRYLLNLNNELLK